MKYLQKLGKALMLPVSVMPICGLLMGLGYCLCPAAMQGGDITGIWAQIGYFLIRAGGALIDHIAWLFAIGVGIGMSENNDGTGAIAALVSWLMIITLLNVETVKTLIPSATEGSSRLLAFSKIENPFIGILSGIIGSVCYNRFHRTKLPDWLSFFSGKRAVAIVAGVVSVVIAFVLLLVWPLVFSGLTAIGYGIEQLGPAGAGLYAFLNRLLIPFGLHHALNNVFWFDTIGLGDLTHFWAGETSADVTWSLGMYMSGFFPCMMFGVPGAALAMIRSAKPERKKAAVGIVLSSAVCAFVCGVTEPFEFAFMFLSPVLYAVYALLYGIISFVTVISGFRAGFSFSAGVTDLVFSSTLPAAAKTWLIIPLGLLSFALFYGVFRFMIMKWDMKTPGRENEDTVPAEEGAAPAGGTGGKYADMARTILRGLGGAENLLSIDNCITRLRLEIRDMGKVNESVIRSSGAAGVIRPGKNALQIVVGTTVQFVADELKQMCGPHRRVTPRDLIFSVPAVFPGGDRFEYVIADKTGIHARPAEIEDSMAREARKDRDEGIRSPAEGELIPMEEIPDPVFSGGVMGECVGVIPANGKIYAPVSGTVATVAAARHAVSLRGNGEEILIHAGLDTVRLNGEGFSVYVSEGENVKQGQLIMEMDPELIRARGFNPMIIVVRISS
jgi:PTS system N-acetylglucosamine-specific IIC component